MGVIPKRVAKIGNSFFCADLYNNKSPSFQLLLKKKNSIEKGGRGLWFVKLSKWEQNVSS